jgi:hypothetical protein
MTALVEAEEMARTIAKHERRASAAADRAPTKNGLADRWEGSSRVGMGLVVDFHQLPDARLGVALGG